jgi:glycosyltransferase involved in cell wall biosynthesis
MILAVMTEVEADSPRAHFVNVVKTAGGFARLGHRVVLFCRAGTGAPDLRARFGEPALDVVVAPGTLKHDRADPAGRAWAFARWAAEEAQRRGAAFVYARTFCGAMAASEMGLATVMETHAHIDDPNPLLQASLEATGRPERPIAGIVTISHRLRDHYIARGARADRVHIVPDGVDLNLFARPEALPERGPMDEDDAALNILYSGHLYDEKGIPTLIDAAPLLQSRMRPARVHLLGGLPADIERARARAERNAPGLVRIHGPVDHAMVPRWLWHADVLVLPPSGRDPSANWTSPVKLGEYLAAGPPIVASSIPALRDWLDERAVRWFEPDNAADLARAIGAALQETTKQAEVRRAHAMELARRFSYPARARAILRAGGAGMVAARS